MNKKPGYLKATLDIAIKVLNDNTDWAAYRPKSAALLAVKNSWTGKYRYFYTMDTLYNWVWKEVI